jgi:hypothetical protein
MRRTTLTFVTMVCLTAAASACGGTHAQSSAQAPSTVYARTGSTTRTTLPTSSTPDRTTTTGPVSAGTTTTTASSPTTTSPPPPTSPATVPSTITPAYVNSVFVVLNHVYGNATRRMIATTDLPPAAVADIRAIFADPEFNTELKIFSLELDQGFAGVKIPPGDRVTTVDKILSSSQTCIYVQTTTSFNAVVDNPSPPSGSEYSGLETKLLANDPQHLNPTSWAIFFNETFPTSTAPPTNPCAS